MKRFLNVLLLCVATHLFGADVPVPLPAFEQALKEHIAVHPSSTNSIGRIVIGDHASEINQSTWLYVKKALDHYKESKPIFIILDLNTPGGEVYAAQNISDALKEMDIQYNIPVIAYIDNWAISAGAMLAYSCRFIVISKDGSMGAAEPVIDTGEGALTTASEKINSVLRADFANRANFFGRNPLIAEAMVDKDMILVLRGEHAIKLDNEGQIQSGDVILSNKGKLLTLNAEQMVSLGVADLLIPPLKVEPLTATEQETGEWPASKSPLFHQPFFDAIPNAVIDTFMVDWKIRFFAILASPLVSSLLMLGMMIGLYVEFTTPGFGLPGTVGVTCLFLIVLSSFSMEVANWLELILLLTGIGIILVEVFVVPTFGLLGFVGIILFLSGFLGMVLPGWHQVEFETGSYTLNAAGEVVFERLAWLCGTFVVGVAILFFMARYLTPNLPGLNRFVLRGNEQDGYVSVKNLASLPKPGAHGVAATTLRPGGKVAIDGELYDAISSGFLIEKGEEISVTGIDSGTLVVTRKTP